MADTQESTVPVVAAEEREEPKAPTMAETQEQPPPPPASTKPEKFTHSKFSIWPPVQRTRDAVINRLIETLSAPSVLSKRYGTIPQEEAADAARRIEGEAFSAASSAASSFEEDDSIEILQVYSKEISKRMLETVKSRSAPSVASGGDSAAQEEVQAAASEDVSSSVGNVSEEISSVEN